MRSDTDKKPKLSKMMIELYGKETAEAVYDRCQELDPIFNRYVQEVIYDELWAMGPLTLKEKSIITVASLIVLRKEEQLTIHLKGLFNLKETAKEVLSLLIYLTESNYIASSQLAFEIISKVFSEFGMVINKEQFTLANTQDLSSRDKALLDLAARVALSDQEKLFQCIKTVLNENLLSEEEIRGVLRHLMTYCGCPSTMNGFAALLSIKNGISL